ncbi:cation transporter [Candidatus Soleaferrea massiliensis]|uniref:cation transporter n=1 Tax=Candidatus Soleaferrea massiliensis TaxID=1470354 RepID=UPI000694D3DB|nr:cation transporter [Candidatus Soleaferrea massiliensis]
MLEKVIILEGLDCANCAAKVERAASRIRGVDNANVTFMTRKLFMEVEDGKLEQVMKELDEVIHRIDSTVVLKVEK